MRTAHEIDAEIRSNPNLLGRAAYEASLAAVPHYRNGTPRRKWEELDDLTRWTWERVPQKAPAA